MPWNFAIRSRVGNPNHPKHQPTYVTIDLMCNLLDIETSGNALTYKRLFNNDLAKVMTEIIAQAKSEISPGKYYIDAYFTPAERGQIWDDLAEIQVLANATQVPDLANPGNDIDIRFRDMYTAARNSAGIPAHEGTKKIWKLFRNLYTRHNQFCMPFVHFLVGKDNQYITVLLDGGTYQGQTYVGIGGLKLLDLYTKTLSEIQPLVIVPVEAKGLSDREIRDLVAFTIRDAQLSGVLINNNDKPNDRCCGTSGCQTAPPNTSLFCSTADTGGCSAQSDSCS